MEHQHRDDVPDNIEELGCPTGGSHFRARRSSSMLERERRLRMTCGEPRNCERWIPDPCQPIRKPFRHRPSPTRVGDRVSYVESDDFCSNPAGTPCRQLPRGSIAGWNPDGVISANKPVLTTRNAPLRQIPRSERAVAQQNPHHWPFRSSSAKHCHLCVYGRQIRLAQCPAVAAATLSRIRLRSRRDSGRPIAISGRAPF